MATVGTIRELLDAEYPPLTAEEWDSVGLICGDPDATVTTVLCALDPTLDVVYEALEVGAQLIVTHHPLFLSGVSTVARDTVGGRVVHEAIAHGIALFNAHTNADHASPGVSDALAAILGVVNCRPLEPGDSVTTGIGRVGNLAEPMPLSAFAERVAATLPHSAAGIRVAGNPDQIISTVAVCGGSGDSLLSIAATMADVYVTSDLKHHKVLDHPRDVCALIDVPHFCSEWPWVPMVAALIQERTAGAVSAVVSTTRTDPWTMHVGL
ncbi:MAG: Nif3-like dinuclear metal center hexameric protein [Candidatus Nanopelagicales bacterium]|nr:Nif3-like dinuclear metal center hexameric protein [Candidatus Nanopelagicales bacterium]